MTASRSRKPTLMTASELAGMILRKEQLFLLDVRNEGDYQNWRIEGDSITVMNKPYFELLDGVEAIVDECPRNQKLLVVCAKEGSSYFVAEQLMEAGITDVYYLQGGMKSWSEHIEPVKVGELKDGGVLYQFVRLGKGCLSYMIISDGEAAVVDAIRLTDAYEQLARENGAVIKHAIDTHLHADHISGGRKLAEASGASYWLPPKDAEETVFPYSRLEEGSPIAVGHSEIAIQPIYSPGHTIGSTSLLIEDTYLLSGDILFVASIGRPDLAGKAEDWVHDLRSSLYETFSRLDPELIVLPAHYGNRQELREDGSVMARLGDLFHSNPGLNIADQEAFRHAVTSGLPPQPHAYQEIRETNMGKLQPSESEQGDMEIGPNRCAIHDR
ncbi:MBL fold metallo-hydrolase [Paenibacillus plantiphilus]|nr:MBL fold metallo-hydrolase [Paenibacillus plantiphilus]